MKDTILSRIFYYLRSFFLSGLLTLLPIVFTIALFTFTYRIIKHWLEPIYRLEPACLQVIPNSEIILVLLFILCTGIIIKLFLLEPLIHFVENIFFKIPLMRPIYGGFKQLVQAFAIQDKLTFKKVVFVEFPRPGLYSIGFLTNALPPEISPEPEHTYFNVFIPTTPNPTSGFLVQVPEKDIIIATHLTRQEAMSLIISGGIIQPDRFK